MDHRGSLQWPLLVLPSMTLAEAVATVSLQPQQLSHDLGLLVQATDEPFNRVKSSDGNWKRSFQSPAIGVPPRETLHLCF